MHKRVIKKPGELYVNMYGNLLIVKFQKLVGVELKEY